METCVELTGVTRRFGEDLVLKEVNLTLEAGRVYGIVGNNGSGKTVLMKCICGFIHTSGGTVKVEERIIGKDCDFPADTGIIIESPEFLPYYSGYQNLASIAGLRGKIDRKQIRAAISMVGLDPDLKLPVRKYSLGMRQRLGLAQAIMENPSLLILDEPMNGLDEEGVQDMRSYLLDLRKQGKTILIASHSAEDIAILCDKTYKLEHGKIVSETGED